MGGHGGLNILPQKSWNVYNWDNREKVARDEREYAEKQKRERDLVLDREQDNRLAALRAKKQRRGIEGSDAREVTTEGEAHAFSTLVVAAEQGALAPPETRHVNLFAEAEAAHAKREAQNEDYLKEKEREELELNKKLSIGLGTSNPQQGNQGDVNHRPWWTEQVNGDLQTELALIESKRIQKEKAIAKKEKKAKKDKKEKKRQKKEQLKEAKRQGKLIASSGRTIDDLRRERLEREAAENVRAQGLGRAMPPPPPEPISKYSFGFHKAESRTNAEYRSRLGPRGRQGC